MQKLLQFIRSGEGRAFLIQAVKFGLVGVLNTLVGFGTFTLLLYVFHLDYRLSNILSYIVGLTNSFIFNKIWTFQSKTRAHRELLPFIVVFMVAFGTQYGVTVLCKEVLRWHPVVAYIAGNVIYTGLGFIGNKLFTFGRPGPQ